MWCTLAIRCPGVILQQCIIVRCVEQFPVPAPCSRLRMLGIAPALLLHFRVSTTTWRQRHPGAYRDRVWVNDFCIDEGYNLGPAGEDLKTCTHRHASPEGTNVRSLLMRVDLYRFALVHCTVQYVQQLATPRPHLHWTVSYHDIASSHQTYIC